MESMRCLATPSQHHETTGVPYLYIIVNNTKHNTSVLFMPYPSEAVSTHGNVAGCDVGITLVFVSIHVHVQFLQIYEIQFWTARVPIYSAMQLDPLSTFRRQRPTKHLPPEARVLPPATHPVRRRRAGAVPELCTRELGLS